MRTLFFGSAAFSVPALQATTRASQPVAVVTAPERLAGRGRRPRPTPVATAAAALGLAVLTPESLTDHAFERAVRELAPEALVVSAYGKMIPGWLLSYASVNVHPSLLPRHRGAAPIAWTLFSLDAETGVTLIRITEKLDAGPILMQRRLGVRDDDNAERLAERLAALSAQMLEALLARGPGALADGRPQGEDGATYASKIDRSLEWLDLHQDRRTLWGKIRGLAPRPGAKLRLFGREVAVLEAALCDGPSLAPGDLKDHGGHLVIGAQDGPLEILSLRPAGRREMRAADFLRGLAR